MESHLTIPLSEHLVVLASQRLESMPLTSLIHEALNVSYFGYNDRYKGYRCLFPPTGRVYISRHVLFDESCFPFSTLYQSLHSPAITPLRHSETPLHPNSESPLCPLTMIPISPNPFSLLQDQSESQSSTSNRSSPTTPTIGQVVSTVDSEEESERTTGNVPASIGVNYSP